MIFNKQVATNSPAKTGVLVRQFSSPLPDSSSAGDLLSPTSFLIKAAKTSQSFRPNAEWAARVRRKIGDSLIRAKSAPDYQQQIAALGLKLDQSKQSELRVKTELEELQLQTALQKVENSCVLKSQEALERKFQTTSEKLKSVLAEHDKDTDRLSRLTISQRELVLERNSLLVKLAERRPLLEDVEVGFAAEEIERLGITLAAKDAELGQFKSTIQELEATILVTKEALRGANAGHLEVTAEHLLEVEELTEERDDFKQRVERTTSNLKIADHKVVNLQKENQALLSIILSLGLDDADLTELVDQPDFPVSLQDKLFAQPGDSTSHVGASNSELHDVSTVPRERVNTSDMSGTPSRPNGGKKKGLLGGVSRVQFGDEV